MFIMLAHKCDIRFWSKICTDTERRYFIFRNFQDVCGLFVIPIMIFTSISPLKIKTFISGYGGTVNVFIPFC